MRTRTCFFVIACPRSCVYADILRMKQGGGVQGTLVSANSQGVVFMGIDGVEKEYPISAVKGIDFAPLPPPPEPKPKPKPAGVVVPAGTEMSVRMIDSISGKTAAASQRYRASIDDPVVVGDRVLIPRGADCTVQVVEVEGGKGLDLKLYDVTIAGKPHATSTDYATVKQRARAKRKRRFVAALAWVLSAQASAHSQGEGRVRLSARQLAAVSEPYRRPERKVNKLNCHRNRASRSHSDLRYLWSSNSDIW